MTSINQSSGQGALFELVARGIKDKYFVKDDKQSIFPYDATYGSSIHHLAERKKIVPINDVKFGNTFEVEIDAYGDIMTECAFEIELPTWLPQLPRILGGQLYKPDVINGLYPITSSSGLSFGYVNYIAYFLFEKIQFYQDQFLIQEWSGDGLLAKQVSEGSFNSSFLEQTTGGLIEPINPITNQPTPRGIQLRATPGSLTLKLPLPGMQCPEDGGFPLVAMSWQTFRIKATLRRLEDLVVCSDNVLLKNIPDFYPWNVNEFKYNDENGNMITFAPLPLSEVGQPTILLSTIQHYVPSTVQQELRSKPIQIPFRRQFENIFTFGELDYVSLDKGGVSAVTRRLDGRHPTERIFWFFRNQLTLDKNRLDDFYNNYFDSHLPTMTQPYTSPYGNYYYRMKLIIAGRDRELLHEPFLWGDILQCVKDEKPSGLNIGCMKWNTGEQYGTVYPAPREPEGTVNFTTADRPTIYVELSNINTHPLLAQRKSEIRVFTEGWNVYEVKEGRGRLMFAN
jgi:hypothetical protein